MASQNPQEILVDVRTPAEITATGLLSNDLYSAVNIEYQSIDELPQVYNARGINVRKSDAITLYCRSGRRSNIALQTLRSLGYENVRDIGGFEEARARLKREEMARSLSVEKDLAHFRQRDTRGQKEGRDQSLGNLLRGLKGLEEEVVCS